MTDPQPRRGSLAAAGRRLVGGRARELEAQLQIERDRITQLEIEIDELRRDSLRVAELVDLVEQRLTP